MDATDLNLTAASTSTAYATPAGHIATNSILNIFSQEEQNPGTPDDNNVGYGMPLPSHNGDLVMSHDQYQQLLQQYMSGLVGDQTKPPKRGSPHTAEVNQLPQFQPQNTAIAAEQSNPNQNLLDVSLQNGSRLVGDLPKATVKASSMLHESFGLPAGKPFSPSTLNRTGQLLDIMATTTIAPQSSAIQTGEVREVDTVASNSEANETNIYTVASAADEFAGDPAFKDTPPSKLDQTTGTKLDESEVKADDDRPAQPKETQLEPFVDVEPKANEPESSTYPVPDTKSANDGGKGNDSVNVNSGDSRKSSVASDRVSAPGETEQSLLIKKQMTEMEKEFSRRFNNKNFKKIGEAELAQWFSDHGFPSLGVTPPFSDSAAEASLPYRPPTGESGNQPSASHPTLVQLRSSFSPPDAPLQAAATNGANFNYPAGPINGFYDAYGNFIPQPSNSFQTAMMQVNPQLHSIGAVSESFPQITQAQHLGATLTGGGLGLHGPAAFLTSPVLPQTQAQCQSQSQIHPQMSSSSGADLAKAALCFDARPPQNVGYPPGYPGGMAPQMQSYFNGFPQQFYRLPHPQQFGAANGGPQPPQQPYATIMSPTMSNITSEMAAVLLQQIQQDNPGLIENLVDQQQRHRSNQTTPASTPNGGPNNGKSGEKGRRSSAGRLPAPPPPQNGVARGAQKHTAASQHMPQSSSREEENGWRELGKRHSVDSAGENKENGAEPIWVMRESYLKRMEREERRNQELYNEVASVSKPEAEDQTPGVSDHNGNDGDELDETEKLLRDGSGGGSAVVDDDIKNASKTTASTPNSKKEVMVHEPAVLIEGVLFRARYLGSTQMTTDGRPTKTSRMAQAQEAVARVKAPSGEIQPSTEIDLFISTEKIMVLNTDLQRISETDVRQDILMDHALRSISYIADIGDLVVLMARRVPPIDVAAAAVGDEENTDGVVQTPRVVCHVFESEEASFIAQSIGQAFQVAYVEFLRANGIDDPAYLREVDYQEVLNSQELMGEELAMFARKETQKDIVIPKKVGEPLGVVVVESGWGSILPTVVVANMAPGGPASRSNQLNIGDQIIGINGISLVGLPLATAQQNIKNAKTSTAVRLTIVSTPPVVEVRIKRPNTKYQLGFSVQNGVICSLLRGGIAERGGIRVGHRIIEINQQSVVAVAHDRIVNLLATATGEIHMKTMPTSMFRLLTGQEVPNYI